MTRSEGPDGVLVLDKPAGPTSHDCVAVARRAYRTRRVGHAGTLDPFATGVLVLALGRATRLVPWLVAGEKDYEGVIRFGTATDTGDATGTALDEPAPLRADLAELRALAQTRLTGDLLQVPPMYSAKKRGGVALYRLARRGETVEREAVPVRVSGWELDAIDPQRVAFRVTCSPGTYVRVLASDLGELAGTPAHLEALRRTRSGSFTLEGATDFETLARGDAPPLVPLHEVPLDLPRIHVDDSAARAFAQGRSLPHDAALPDTECAVHGPDGTLLGIARADGARLHPRTVLAAG